MSSETAPSRFVKSRSWMPVCRIVIAFAVAIVLTSDCLAGFASFAQSRIGVLELDPSRTLVEFRLGGSLHTTHGKFRLERGIIKGNAVTGKAEGAIVVDAASGDSGDSLRDNRMKDGVLEAQGYPEITFSPRRIDSDFDSGGGFQAKLEGLLKLHGADHEIIIDAHGSLIDENLVATAHFSIPYVEWGLRDPSLLFLTVAKQVDIDIATAGRVTWLTGEESIPAPTLNVP
jgi:polyisoprenoid-binding protein YceI